MKFVPAKAGRLETEQKIRLKPGRSLSLAATHPRGHQKTSLQSENPSHRMAEDITAHVTDKVLISETPRNNKKKTIP